MKLRFAHRAVLAIGVVAATLLAVVAINTVDWIGRTFPGFFVISNRVVASIALPDWSGEGPSRFFQCQVLAVDGVPVSTPEEIYARAERTDPGSPLRYTFRRADGELFDATIETRRFSAANYLVLFGAYLITGIVFLGTGLFVFSIKQTPASVGLLASTVATGAFIITAADLYGPHWFVRLHVLAESLLAPSFVHLALVFPTERLGPWRRRLIGCLYGAFALFAAVYEIALDSPSAYTAAHLVASASHGAGALILVGVVTYDFLRSHSPLVRRRVAVVALGTLSAFLVPGLLMMASALLGGRVPLNAGIVTACLFPLSLGFAIVKRDLFELDVLVRRAVTYTIVVTVIVGLYFAVFSGAGSILAAREGLMRSPAALALLNLALVLLATPLRDRVQRGVDRIFFRSAYVAESAVSELGQTLVTAHTIGEVVTRTRRVLDGTIWPTAVHLFAWQCEGALERLDDPSASPTQLCLPPTIRSRLEDGEILARYEWDDGSDQPMPELWQEVGADLLIPVGSGDPPLAVLALGRKASGRPYDTHDVSFLRTVASQLALALTNAGAFARLADLNANLEREVRERTASLEKANVDLAASLRELQGAYAQLERNQASLVRAERLATLGRLTAAIAHEVNTPLGAVQNTLKLLRDLSREYAESVDDPSVTREDHREIARELEAASDAATSFARKAATFINKVRIHGRDARADDVGEFAIATVVAEAGALVAHRLRLSGCALEVDVDRALAARGSPGLFSQVLINLITNAIDAYEDAGLDEGSIEVRARRSAGAIAIAVRDRAGGVAADILPHIFDELFTTKDPGRGTGLGLWIARNVVEQSFGGTLTVEVDPGVGSTFTIEIPEAAAPIARTAPIAASPPGGDASPPA